LAGKPTQPYRRLAGRPDLFRMKVSYSWYKRNIGPDIRKKHVVEYGPSCGLGDEMRAS
jgi:hypothetical protein